MQADNIDKSKPNSSFNKPNLFFGKSPLHKSVESLMDPIKGNWRKANCWKGVFHQFFDFIPRCAAKKISEELKKQLLCRPYHHQFKNNYAEMMLCHHFPHFHKQMTIFPITKIGGVVGQYIKQCLSSEINSC